MVFYILTLVCLLIAALLLLLSFKALFNPRWILGWLRGSLGLSMIVVAILSALVALDLSSYRQVLQEDAIGSASFKQVSTQKFEATLALLDGAEQEFTIYGDLWQIDARILKWSKPLAALGLKPGYRMGRISGRYYSIEHERTNERSVFELDKREFGLDIWHWLSAHSRFLPWVDAVYGNATFLPMSNDALFTLYLTSTGIIARPENEPAKKAASEWQ